MYHCRVCPTIEFISEKNYLLHIRDSHDGKIADSKMCDACGKTFQTTSQLKSHKRAKCGTERSFTCKECGKKLMSAGSLHNHLKIHNEKGRLMCRFCAKLFNFIGQLKIHEKIHTKEKDFICQECGKSFAHRQSLITHFSTHSGVKPYQCESCSRGFSCIGNLLKHRKTFKDSCGLLPMTSHTVQNPCTKMKVMLNTPDSCRLKKVQMKRRLDDKLTTLDNTEGTDDILNNKSESEIKNNSNSIDAVPIQNIIPNVQNYTLLDNSEEGHPDLTINNSKDCSTKNDTDEPNPNTKRNSCQKAKHSKEYLYICESCGKIYKHKFMLESHQQSNCDKVVTHQCNVCDKSFSNKHTLASHVKIHTSKKEFSCKFCPKTFRWKGQVKIHERSHTGEKPFTCLFCPSVFTYRESLLIHSYKHTGNKPYVCKCCGWRFSCVGNFNKHKKTHFDSCGLWYREYEMRLDKKQD